MGNHLYRSRTNEVLGGVCGGLGEYLGIDPTLVRLVFILFTLAGGSGILIYLLLWVIIPRQDSAVASPGMSDFGSRIGQVGQEFGEAVRNPNPVAAKYIGGGLIAAGFLLILKNLDIPWLRWLNGDVLWAVLLIVLGGALIWRNIRGGK